MKKAIIIVIAAIALLSSCSTMKGFNPSNCDIIFENVNGGRISNCATILSSVIGTQYGVSPSAHSSTTSFTTDGNVILLGNTGWVESLQAAETFVTPMDYIIQIKGNKTVIVGMTSFATAAATEKYIELISEDPAIAKSKNFTYEYHFDLSYINPICNDVSSFKPKWTALYDMPPAWMDDFYETLYAVSVKGGRQTAFAHRGDFKYYPQSSLEGLLSAILAGADVVEVDFRLTKDNIPIMMHDEDLRKNTNCASKMGKNGLPNSYYVGDWTYEQLRQLNMIMNTGANTNYKVATCYEALLIAKQFGAQITWDDKADETTVKVFAATKKTSMEDFLPMMNYTDTLQYFLYYYGYYHNLTNMNTWRKLEGTSDSFKKALDFFEKCYKQNGSELPGSYGYWNGDVRYLAWGYDKQYEIAANWDLWMTEGRSQIWTNCIVDCCRNIAEKYQPEDYSAFLK